MFGYAYSGFLSMQKAVDEYILSAAAGERMYLNVSMGLFPEQVRPSAAVARPGGPYAVGDPWCSCGVVLPVSVGPSLIQ